MELRRVQRTNSGTFLVSLPKEWALRVGLDKGKVMGIAESVDGSLCLDPKYEAGRAPLSVVLRPSPYLGREIVGKYLLGYDVIRVEAKGRFSTEERTLVKQTSSRLIGLEIVEEDYASIGLQCLLEPSASSPERILKREYNIAASMHRDALSAFLAADANLARNVIARDVEVNRFYFLLVRVLRTAIQNPRLGEKLGIHSIDCLDYRLCASFVEAMGDRAVEISHKNLALEGNRVSSGISESLGALHSRIFRTQEESLRAFFEHDVALAEQVRDKREKIEHLLQKVELAASGQTAVSASLIVAAASAVYRIFDHSVDIADLVMPRQP
jgi:phosphate uptake regulator